MILNSRSIYRNEFVQNSSGGWKILQPTVVVLYLIFLDLIHGIMRYIVVPAHFDGSCTLSKQPGSSEKWRSLVKTREKPTYKYLELKAIHFALVTFKAPIQNFNVGLNCDNTTPISYIDEFGGCHNVALNYLSRQIWLWCIYNKVSINSVPTPGLDNHIPYSMSHKFSDDIRWSLDNQIFTQLCQVFGNLQIDLFASRLNKKLSHYFSWRPDPFCGGANAFCLLMGQNVWVCLPTL